ncbi:MAG TPA: phenylalanine 4-monooxygenase [Pseudolabrys sp.]|nr:phenylalanine 4-monooxygenase [Pseudolabrys sp.]
MAFITVDPRTHAPVPPNFVVAQRPQDYSAQDHATWRTLFRRQSELLHGRAVEEFHDGLAALGITADGIPDFDAMNHVLMRATGWRVIAVPGLVPDEVFFAHLAARRFPAGYWIRKPEQLDYIEEPDVFHDVFGHVPLLMQPRYAEYMAAYGRAGLTLPADALKPLARLYWYTVEFGLMQTADGLRIFGAGIMSSAGEAIYALDSATPARMRFDCERVLRSDYKIDDFQRIYFVLAGYDDLPALDRDALATHIAAVHGKPVLAPGELIASDVSVALTAH